VTSAPAESRVEISAVGKVVKLTVTGTDDSKKPQSIKLTSAGFRQLLATMITTAREIDEIESPAGGKAE
jgi:hypothetical protein